MQDVCVRETISNRKNSTISSTKARRVVHHAASNLGCTIKELKRAIAGASVIPSTLIRKSLKEAADKVGCTVDDVRLAIIAEGTEYGVKVTPGKARRLYDELHSVERVVLAVGRPIDEVREALECPERRGRKPRPHDPAERARLLNLLNKHKSTRLAAEACGLSQTTFLRRIKEPVRAQ